LHISTQVDIFTSIDMTATAVGEETSPAAVCCRPLAAPRLSELEADATAALFRALAEPARVKILNLLATSEVPVCACEFEPALGLAQPTVSHHLKRLTDAGLLTREQRGRWAYFSLRPEALRRIVDIIELEEVSA
jgi:ArsR family transcriptional regulator, arsenate/arsenite/antimonite-responsive transcriptional repressor